MMEILTVLITGVIAGIIGFCYGIFWAQREMRLDEEHRDEERRSYIRGLFRNLRTKRRARDDDDI